MTVCEAKASAALTAGLSRRLSIDKRRHVAAFYDLLEIRPGSYRPTGVPGWHQSAMLHAEADTHPSQAGALWPGHRHWTALIPFKMHIPWQTSMGIQQGELTLPMTPGARSPALAPNCIRHLRAAARIALPGGNLWPIHISWKAPPLLHGPLGGRQVDTHPLLHSQRQTEWPQGRAYKDRHKPI